MNKKKSNKEISVVKVRKLPEKSTKETIIDCKIQYENNKKKLVNNMLLKVGERIERLDSNQKFTLKEILYDVWNLFSDKVKRSIGKKFSKLVSENNIINIDVYKKGNNKTIYIKV